MRHRAFRWLKWLGILVLAAVVCVVVVLKVRPVRWVVGRVLQRIGLIGGTPRPSPRHDRPAVLPANSRILPADRVTARRLLVAELYRAYAQHDFEKAAFLNSILSQEAFQRAWRTQQAWRAVRDPETGLIPREAGREDSYWVACDTAADCFPFMLIAALYLDREGAKVWLDALAREREISGPMPRSILFNPARVKREKTPAVVFGASEYAKDGLLAICERFGRGPWFDRLEETAQALIEAAWVRAKVGKLCGCDTEVNGEVLQVLTRLYWATGRSEYLEMAERTAEAYLFEVLPNNDWLPALVWDFPGRRAAKAEARLDDHGNELIVGLAELYLLEKLKGRPNAARYREPLERCLDTALAAGRNEDGLWYGFLERAGGSWRGCDVSDTWGYISSAYLVFDMAEGSSKYTAEIERTMRAVSRTKSFPWEGEGQDGYADAIESMLYLLPWFDIPECHRWVDDEIEVLFGMQRRSGFVDAQYLDGNFIRTALLYAFYKTQGVLVEPWRQDVCLGAALDRETGALYLHVSAQRPWEGWLRFDVPRHRTIWGLPVNYPRLNSSPEWFVVDEEATYRVAAGENDADSTRSGKELVEGLSVVVADPTKPVRFTISPQ